MNTNKEPFINILFQLDEIEQPSDEITTQDVYDVTRNLKKLHLDNKISEEAFWISLETILCGFVQNKMERMINKKLANRNIDESNFKSGFKRRW